MYLRLYAGIEATYRLDDRIGFGAEVTADSLLYGGAVWVGAMTPFGPARLAYGLAEGGRAA